jgi:cardiolipin synthase
MEIDWTLTHVIAEWLIRLVMLVWVPQRRSPSAARTWLLCIFFFPYVGLVLYWLIGRPYMPRRRIAAQARVSHLIRTVGREHLQKAGLTRPDVKQQFTEAVTLAQNLGDFGILGGNSIELLADYASTIDRLVTDIEACQHHAHLLYYIFADDDTGRRVGDALARAVKRGVQCRVLMDFLGSKKSRRTLAPRLREAGIDVHFMLPVSLLRRGTARYDLRNHRKIVVLDGRIGYVGSQNLVNADFKEGLTYEELVARITGPAVLQLQVVFLADHFFETDKLVRDEIFFPPQEQPGTSPVQVLPSGPGYPHANTLKVMVALIHGARERVVITTPYFIPDSPLMQALETAVLRGVDVHLIVSHQIDQILVGLAQRSYYEDLLECGVKIHEYYQHFLHAKHMSVDDQIALVGSSNMDIRSFRLNSEVSVLIYDAQVAGQLRALQERYFANADLLTLEKWQQRPPVKKSAQNMARLVDSLL